MKSVDKFFERLSKRQKYLCFRIIVIILLVIFGINTLYETVNISPGIFFNTMFLFYLPLFLEYFLGMDTYSGYTNTSRWIGFIIGIVSLLICLFGFMGKITIVLDKKGYIEKILLLNSIQIMTILKAFAYIIIGISVFDFIFTLNKREIYFYKMLKAHEDLLDENYEKYKKEQSIENRAKRFKEQLLNNIGE